MKFRPLHDRIVVRTGDYAFGFDVQGNAYGDMFQLAIVDSAKVVRTALQDAASVAGLLMTTEAMVAELPKKAAPAAPAGGAGMDF